MKKTLKKGFTLIELMVVIAIIGILATTLAPKLREQLAKAKDAKAISLLGATRTAASAILIDDSISENPGKALINWTVLVSHLDVTTKGLVGDSGLVKIGGSRKGREEVLVYNGEVQMSKYKQVGAMLVIQALATAGGQGDTLTLTDLEEASSIHLNPKINPNPNTNTNAGDFSTEKKRWISY